MTHVRNHIVILLIEDNPDHAELICRSFGGDPSTYTIRTVGSLSEARTFLAQSTPTIVIADLRLPDGHASALIDELHGPPRIPLLALTSYADAQLEHEVIEAGADGIVEKSDSAFFELHTTVAKLLAKLEQSKNR